MNWENDPDLLAAEEDLPKNCTLTLRHSHVGKNKTNDESLFGTNDFITQAHTYNIIQPGANVGNSLLSAQNPGLLAFRNKTLKNPKPTLISPIQNKRVPPAKLQSSLGKQKPLSSLKESRNPPTELFNKELLPEEISLNFSEDPVAYFSKHKDGQGLRFIYLVHAQDPKDFDFSPYNLRKVTSAEIGNDYFMMSATGVTHIDETGDTETVSLDQWARESSIYEAVRRLKLFKQYFYWYPFTIWKKFVRRRRFEELQNSIKSMAFFRNPILFQSECSFYSSLPYLDKMIKDYLLCFQEHTEYSLPIFEEKSEFFKNELKTLYVKYIKGISYQIAEELYSKISDKSRTEVHDVDFWVGRKKSPNIMQMVNLEKKKSELRKEKTYIVNQEIMALGGLIRSADLMILETQINACLYSFKRADEIVSTDLSAIFKLDLIFNDDGSIGLTPTLDQIESSVDTQMRTSIKMLSALPRLLHDVELRPFIRDSGTDIDLLYRYGPSFSMLLKTHREHLEASNHILEIIRKSYGYCVESISSFSEYYEIYKYGQDWSVQSFVHSRSGKPYTGEISPTRTAGLSIDDFLINNQDEPTVNLDSVKNALAKYTNDEKRIANIRQKTYKGALFIDASQLTEILTPIPKKAIQELKHLLSDLTVMKINLLENVLKSYSLALKNEPKLLETYISLCSLVTKTEKLMPTIIEEIGFVNQATSLLEKYGETLPIPNPLDKLFSQFQIDQQAAIQNKDTATDEFIGEIKSKIEEMEKTLSRLYADISSMPATLELVANDVDNLIKKTEQQREKAFSLRNEIQELVDKQKTTGIQINDFKFYDTLLDTISATLLFYQTVSEWQRLSVYTDDTPFAEIDMDRFIESFDKVSENVDKLSESKLQSNLVKELKGNVYLLKPVLGNLSELSKAPLKRRHWDQLFELCGIQEEYNPSMSMKALFKLGILIQNDVIQNTTSTAIAESEVEVQFIKIREFWQNNKLKHVETTILSEETLALAPIEPTVLEINDALLNLNRICSVPYSISIRSEAMELINKLKLTQTILEAWFLFQENFNVISALFKSEETKKMLPRQSDLFQEVLKKWHQIATHTIKDTRILSVIQYPNLYLTFRELDQTLEEIMSTTTPLLDRKRMISPRLNFLSDLELLTLITTKSFDQFSSIASKIFMGISRIDPREQDQDSYELVPRLKFYGMSSPSGDYLSFLHPVNYNRDAETLTNELVEAMQLAVKESIAMGLINFPTLSFSEFITTVPTYIAEIVLNIVTTNELIDCVKTIELNPKAGENIDTLLQRRISDVLTLRRPDATPKEIEKVSTFVIFLSSIRDRARNIVKARHNYQQELAMSSILKFNFSGSTNEVIVEINSSKWNFGYEFWGEVPRMIFTPELEEAYQEFATNASLFGVSLITGETHTGKLLLARFMASMFGAPFFILNSFTETSNLNLKRIIVGTAATGAWTVMAGIEKLKQSSLSYIFDSSWEMNCMNTTGKIYIEGFQHTFNRESKLIFTTSTPNALPPQILQFARVTTLRKPSLEIIAAIKLQATGFHNYTELAPKLVSFMESVRNIFHFDSVIYEMNTIIEKAFTFRRTGTEDAQLASACLDKYDSQCHDNVLTHLVYAAFPIGSTLDELIQKVDYARFKESKENLKLLVIKEVQRLNVKVPVEMIAQNIVTIKEHLDNNNCVIVVGPPSTGKSLMINVLERVMERHEYREQFPDDPPIKVFPIYMSADKPENIYGHTKADGVFYHGQIISLVQEQAHNAGKHTVVIKFDGPITREFDNFLTSFIGSPEMSTLTLGSLDRFSMKKAPKIIIETSDLSNASPSLISRAAIVMSYGKIEKHCLMAGPNFTLSHAIASGIGDFTNDTINKVLEIFQQIAPPVVTQVFHMKNPICFIDEPHYTIDDIRYITEALPVYAATLTLQQFMFNKDLLETEEGIVLAFIHSFAHTFGGVFNRKNYDKFDKWLIDHYKIQIEKWPDYVPQDFIKVFPEPALESTVIEFNKLRPLASSTNAMPNKRFITPQLFPVFNDVVQCLQAKLNILLYCNSSHRKNKIIGQLLDSHPWIKPIRINSSKNLTAKMLALFIQQNMKFNIKDEDYHNQYVLIVENIQKDDLQMMELVRMIINEKKIRLYSPYDPKYSEYISLPNMRVIVTTNNYASLPSRFLAQFVPLRLDPYDVDIAKDVSKKYLLSSGLSQAKVDWIINYIAEIAKAYQKEKLVENSIIETTLAITSFPEKLNPTFLAKAIMGELFQHFLHVYKIDDLRDKIMEISQAFVPGAIEKKAISDFIKFRMLCITQYNSEKDGIFLKEMTFEKAWTELKALTQEMIQQNHNPGLVRFYPTSIYMYFCLKKGIETPNTHIIYMNMNAQQKLAEAKLIAYSNNMNFVHILSFLPDNKLIELIKKSIDDAIHGKKTVFFVESNDGKMQELLLNFCTSHNFIQYFTTKEMDEMYKVIMKDDEQYDTFDQYSSIYNTINSMIHKSVTIICSMPSDVTPKFKPNNMLVINPPDVNENDIIFYVKSRMNESPMQSLIRDHVHDLPELIAKLFRTAPQSTLKNSQFPLDLIDYFFYILALGHSELDHHLQMCSKASVVLKEMDMEIKNLNSRMDTLNPLLNAIRVDSDTMSKNYTTKKDAVDSRTDILTREMNSRSSELKELTDKVTELMNEYKRLEPLCEKAKSILVNLTDNDVKTIRLAAEEFSPFIKSMFECFCIFLGEEPSLTNCQLLLSREDLIKLIIEHVQSFKLGPYEQGLIDRYFSLPEFKDIKFDSMVPGLKALFDQLQYVTQITKTRTNLQIESEKLTQMQEDYNKFESESNLELSSLETVKTQLAKDYDVLQSLLKQRETYEEQYKEISDRQNVLNSITDNLDLLRESWDNDISDTQRQKKLLASSLLLSYSIVYCYPFEENQRIPLYENGKEIIGSLYKINENIDDFVATHLSQKYTDNFKGRIDCLSGTQLSSIISLAQVSKQFLIIFDKEGFVFHALESIPNTKIVSQSVPNIDEIIAESMKEGVKLIITDVYKLTPAFVTLADEQDYSADSKGFTINSELIIPHPDFQIIIITNKNPEDIPSNILTRLKVLNCNTEKSAVAKDFFYSLFLNYLKKDSQKQLIDALAAEVDRKTEMARCKEKALEIINQESKEGFLNNEEQIKAFCEAKYGYFIGVGDKKEIPELNQYIEDIAPFEIINDLICKIWSIINRALPRINNNISFGISQYAACITDCLAHDGITQKPSEQQLQKLKKSLMISTLQLIFSTLPIADSYGFACRLASAFKSKSASEVEMDKFAEALSLVFTRLNEKISFTPQRIPENIDLTYFSSIGTADIFRAIHKFIAKNTIDNFDTFIPPFQPDNCFSSSSSQPTIVLTAADTNPVPIIHMYAMNRSRLDSINVVTLTDNLESAQIAEKMFANAIKISSTTIVHYAQPTEEGASVISDLYFKMKSGQVDPSFRLVIICSSTQYLSSLLILEAKKVGYERPFMLRNYIQQLFGRYSSSIQSSTNTLQIKRLSYSLLLTVALSTSRTLIRPGGYINSFSPNIISFYDILKMIPFVVAASPNDIPLENLYIIAQRIILSSVSNKFDRTTFDSMIRYIISQDSLEDGFSIVKKDKSKWTVPGDIPLSGLSSLIMNLPNLPGAKPFGMPKSALRIRDWRLSRWILEPFTRIITFEYDFTDAYSNLNNMLSLVPSLLHTEDTRKFESAKGLFLLHEIEKYNEICSLVRRTISRALQEIQADPNNVSRTTQIIAEGNIPSEWKEVSHIYSFSTTASFIGHMNAVYNQLNRWLQESVSPVVDISCVFNYNELLISHLVETALEMKETLSDLHYEFALTPDKVEVEKYQMILSNVSLGFGRIKDGRVVLMEDTNESPFSVISGITCIPVSSAKEKADDKDQNCAQNQQQVQQQQNQAQQAMNMLESPPSDENITLYDVELPLVPEATEQKSNSSIFSIKLQSTVPQEEFERAGTTFYGLIQEQFR